MRAQFNPWRPHPIAVISHSFIFFIAFVLIWNHIILLIFYFLFFCLHFIICLWKLHRTETLPVFGADSLGAPDICSVTIDTRTSHCKHLLCSVWGFLLHEAGWRCWEVTDRWELVVEYLCWLSPFLCPLSHFLTNVSWNPFASKVLTLNSCLLPGENLLKTIFITVYLKLRPVHNQ